MKFLTSLMSVGFSLFLLFLSAMIISSFKINKLEVHILLCILFLLALSFWILFLFLDWMYRQIHPTMFHSSWTTDKSNTDFTIIQSVVSSLRSAVLNLAFPTVSWSLLLVVLIPFLLVTNNLLWITILELFVFLIMGILVQGGYQRGALKFMMEKSDSKAKKRSKNKKNQYRVGKLQIRILDKTKEINLSKRGIQKDKSAAQIRRLARVRDIGGPIAALLGIISMNCFIQPATDPNFEQIISLLVVWGILFLAAWIGSVFILTDRTPLRQLRLGIGLWIHALLVAIAAPFIFLFELAGHSGRPGKQWSIVPKLGRWISTLLRSHRLYWFPAILVATVFFQKAILETRTKENELFFWSFLCFFAGIIAYEIIHRLFNYIISRQQRQSNRLVFLRVFGDRRRGRFLFKHIVPRWKGLGSITCIAAPDVSIHQLEADIGFDIIFGRLRHRFLSRDEAKVIGRHINSDALGAVWEDHCFDDSWMSAVHSMLTQNAIVLMDLRGFGPQRKGCIYELSVLRDYISVESVVFLIDETTDYKFLKNTLERLWKTIEKNSPNTKSSHITIFKMSTSKGASAKQLKKLLIEACVSNEAYHQSHGRDFLKQLINDLQLLAADAPVQIKVVGGGRTPGKKVLEAGYSSDHDLGSSDFLASWGLITDQQYEAINDVNDVVQEIRCDSSKLSAAAMNNDPDWKELRNAARNCLKTLGKRRSSPKPLTK